MTTDSKKKSVDLEERFTKKFSPTILVGYLNSSAYFYGVISKELDDQMLELLEEAQKMGPKASAVVSLDSDDFENMLLAGPPDRRLHRSLYRQSRFFNEIKSISLTFDKQGKAVVTLHREEDPLRTASSITFNRLDTFNQYVLLHILPYFRKHWKAHIEDENYQRVHKILEEVVMDKIGGLREQAQEAEN